VWLAEEGSKTFRVSWWLATLLVAFGTIVGGSGGPGSWRCRHLGAGDDGSCMEVKLRLKKRAYIEERMRNDNGNAAASTVVDDFDGGRRRQHWPWPAISE